MSKAKVAREKTTKRAPESGAQKVSPTREQIDEYYVRENGRVRRVVGATYRLMAKTPEPGGDLWQQLCDLADKYMNASEEARPRGDQMSHAICTALMCVCVAASQTTTREEFRDWCLAGFSELQQASAGQGALQ